MGIQWSSELHSIAALISEGKTLEEIGSKYGVSKQRMYQVFTKYGLNTLVKTKKSFLKDKEPKYYWLNKMLTHKKVPKALRVELLNELDIPDVCPCLGIKLNYDGTGESLTRTDSSPSLDRIDSSKGYEVGNIQIISWRANRIKNDATPDELILIASYIRKITS